MIKRTSFGDCYSIRAEPNIIPGGPRQPDHKALEGRGADEEEAADLW